MMGEEEKVMEVGVRWKRIGGKMVRDKRGGKKVDVEKWKRLLENYM